MKKVVLCLVAVLALTATVCAQCPEPGEAITITAVPSGDTLTIGYNATGATMPVGISMIVDCGVGSLASAGDADFSIDSFFDVFIDFAADDPNAYKAGADPLTGILVGAHGLAKTDAAGAVTFATAESVFAISAAELANTDTIPAIGTICVLTLSGTPATVTFSADTLRGQIVDVNGCPMDVTLPGPTVVPGTPTECLKDLGGQEYLDWAAFGKPDCWCFQRQCKGDANGLQAGPYWVSGADLTIFKGAFNQATLPAGGICADFNHAAAGPYRVSGADLTIFKAGFNQATVPCCDADGDCVLDAGDKYNFWKP